jgi:hypothetical protein
MRERLDCFKESRISKQESIDGRQKKSVGMTVEGI